MSEEVSRKTLLVLAGLLLVVTAFAAYTVVNQIATITPINIGTQTASGQVGFQVVAPATPSMTRAGGQSAVVVLH
ncbi:MAG TPA: hypothetical protein VGQ00_04195 [Candidatus Norongarragalinales archaeon]|jgi:hypothetical protein|nr:hypothetical protein [Candidatus Norongarragalinales archaeon]